MGIETKEYDLYRKTAVKQVTFDNSGTDTEQLTERDTFVLVDSALGAGTVYLPPVSKCPGMFVFLVQSGTGTNVTTIRDFGIGSQTVTDCLDNTALTVDASFNAQWEWQLWYNAGGLQWVNIAADASATVSTP